MSRTLKRPMFRRGGEVNDGIVGLAQPRRNYSTGKTREEMIEEIFETSGLTKSGKSYAETAMRLANLGRPSDQDLLTNVLIQGGLKGLSTTGGGSAVANLAKAFEAGTLAAITKEVQNALGKDVVGEEARIKAVNLAPKVAKARTTPGIFYQGILIMDKKDTSKPDLGYMASQPDGAIFLNPNNNLFYT